MPVIPPRHPVIDQETKDRLIALCKGDPECIENVNKLINLLQYMEVWPFGMNRCHVWADKCKKAYKDSGIIFPITPVEPYYTGIMPWGAHSVLIVKIKDKEIFLDKRLQGGRDHIAFEDELHPDLVYPKTKEWKKLDDECQKKLDKQRERRKLIKKWRHEYGRKFPWNDPYFP